MQSLGVSAGTIPIRKWHFENLKNALQKALNHTHFSDSAQRLSALLDEERNRKTDVLQFLDDRM